MAIEIYRRGDWDRWEYGDFHAIDILRLDAEKDRWLLWYILSHISENRRRRLMARLRMDQLPEPPVNVDDRDDALYAPYTGERVRVPLRFIPYYAFANRGVTDMIVWVDVQK